MTSVSATLTTGRIMRYDAALCHPAENIAESTPQLNPFIDTLLLATRGHNNTPTFKAYATPKPPPLTLNERADHLC